ncbi:MAG: hypothetical protein FJW39_20535 [Acidobacteria bacterium]|nr:hypothetical protein [Acidobacteriota bacterium]
MPPAELACPQAPQFELFRALEKLSFDSPAAALQCAPLLRREEQRERVLRAAFLSAAESDPKAAAAAYPALANRAWTAETGFFAAVRMARGLDPALGRRLLTAVVRRTPSVAVREVETLRELAYGMEIWREAARGAPDEAALVAMGNSQTAANVRAAAASLTSDPEIRFLAGLTSRQGLDPLRKQRIAACARWIVRGQLSFDRVHQAASNAGSYFALLAGLRIPATGEDAQLLDRVMETLAQVLFRWGDNSVDLARLPARELYLLLSYGRGEEDEEQFSAIFDKFLAPKLRAAQGPVWDLHLRRFLTTAIVRNRLDAFLDLAGEQILTASMRGVHTAEKPLEETVHAAAIVDAVRGPARVKVLRDALESELRQAAGPSARGLYGLLAARLSPKLADGDPLRKAAEPFRAHFREPRELAVQPLFRDGTAFQRMFFYNDEDGVDSFEQFRSAYQGDPEWTWEQNGTWVHVASRSGAPRRIEIYANVPVIALNGEADSRIQDLSKLMAERGISPSMVVHRGHAYHVDRTISALNASARFVYLGSCRGTDKIDAVMASARSAQIIATRSIGTKEINDPVLKSLNAALLGAGESLDWRQFWSGLESRLGHYRLFADYIPPDRNSAAILLAAYYDYLVAE